MLKPAHLTATVDGMATAGSKLVGYIINSHTNGTIKAWDNVVASGSEYLHNTITLAAGPQVITFPRPLEAVNGISFTVGGTLDAEAIIE